MADNHEDVTYEYVYLLQPTDLFGTNVYKYGKTIKVHNRFNQYPVGSAIYYVLRVINCTYVEDCIGKLLEKHYSKHMKGKEYYVGDYIDMIQKIENLIDNLNQKHENQEDYGQMLKRFYNKKLLIRTDYREPIKCANIPKTEITKKQKITINENKKSNKVQKSTYICNICERSFNRKDNLEYHMDKNACKEYTHYCKHCNKGFTTETSMYRHIRNTCDAKNEKDDEIHEELNNVKQELEKLKRETAKNNKTLTRVIKNLNK